MSKVAVILLFLQLSWHFPNRKKNTLNDASALPLFFLTSRWTRKAISERYYLKRILKDSLEHNSIVP